MMKYKLLALDIDGTIRSSNGEVFDETTTSIKELKKQNVVVTILSGKSPESVIQYATYLGIHGLASSNHGAIIFDTDTRKIFRNVCFPSKIIRTVLSFCETNGFTVFVYTPTEKVLIHKTSTLRFSDIRNFVETKARLDTVSKIIMIVNPGEENTIKHEIKALVGPARVFVTKKSFVEIAPEDSDKGSALKFISDYYGIKLNECVSIGDDENDISTHMIVGKSIALKNACQELKKTSGEISHFSNDDRNAIFSITKEIFRF